MLEFLWKFIAGPIVAEAIGGPAVWKGVEAVAGYNIYNTVLWAVLAVFAVLLIPKIFERDEIELDGSKALALVPLIVFAGVLRFVQDAIDLPLAVEILLITPVIYIWVAAIAIAIMLSREYLDLKYRYINGIIITAIFAVISILEVPLIAVAGVTISSGIITGLYYYLTDGTEYQSYPLALAVMSQFFEAFSSIYGFSQGYEARQLITSTVVDLIGASGFLAVKIVILGLALDVFTELEDRWRFILLVALYSIGFATGTRVVLRASLGV